MSRAKRSAGLLVQALVAGVLLLPGAASSRPALRMHHDEAPPGVDLGHNPTTDELEARTVVAPWSAASNSIACDGNGTDGNRVQAIYARASNVADRYAQVAGLIAQYAADADYQINVSAGASGGGRRIRFVTQNCQLDIDHVVLTSGGDNSFSATRNELRAMGYDAIDRKYLVWVDAAVGICGIAEMYGDDRAGASNWNNDGDMIARVDAPCWGYAETHELLHTLGAVQDSAPHSTGAGHCVDESDTMCYSDTSGLSMSTKCPGTPSWNVDCNLDDYFNVSPAAGSYLATHWNTANSSFLASADSLPPAPSILVTAPSSFYASYVVPVSATVSVPVDRTYTVAWTTTLAGCKFAGTSFYCPASATGSGQIIATVVDSLGMSSSSSKTFTLKKPLVKRLVITGLSRSPSRIAAGATSKLTGAAIDALTGTPLAGLRVSLWYRRAGSSTWKKITTRTTGAHGTFAYTVSPPKSTYYKLVTNSTATWASDTSASKKVTVI